MIFNYLKVNLLFFFFKREKFKWMVKKVNHFKEEVRLVKRIFY
jgi:hypothetical protein